MMTQIHSFSQPPMHPCFAWAIELIAYPKITQILSFSRGFFIKSGILYTLIFHLHTLSCYFWLNLEYITSNWLWPSDAIWQQIWEIWVTTKVPHQGDMPYWCSWKFWGFLRLSTTCLHHVLNITLVNVPRPWTLDLIWNYVIGFPVILWICFELFSTKFSV